MLKADFIALADKQPVTAANGYIQLFTGAQLERRQQLHHRRIRDDRLLIRQPGFTAILIRDFMLQINRNELIIFQRQLAIAKGKIAATDIFAPLLSLHDPDAILPIGLAGLARLVIRNAAVSLRHTDGIV